jgi:AcrR family transcriptional regulator
MGARGNVTTRAGRPRDARIDAAIMAATIELLEERGYADLSLAAVADRAGTTTAAIYRRWSSKADLVMQAAYRTDGDDVVADTGDLVADLTTMVTWSADKLCRPAGRAALVGLLSESQDARRRGSVDAAIATVRVAERLERARDAGEIRADIDVHVLVDMIAGPVLQASLSGRRAVDSAWIAMAVSIIVDGITPSRSGPTRRRDA